MRQLIYIFTTLISLTICAQNTDKLVTKGNVAFSEKRYGTAELKYREAESKDPLNTKSAYNLGNTIYRINQFSESKYAFAKVIENSTDKTEKHRAFHNIGNVFMKEKKYAEAAEAYKNALRNNPSDNETRYNYALAKKLAKENPDKSKDKKDKDKDKKDEDKKEDQKKENKDKEGDKDKDKNKDESKKPEDQKDQNKKDEPQDGKFSKQRMESLLEAINNEEKKVQDKVNAKKIKANPVRQEKDW